jgi:transposase-like protein
MPVSDIPSRLQFMPIISSEQNALRYLIENRVIIPPTCCEVCQGPVSVHGLISKCTSFGCRKSVSLLRNSFFAKNRISLDDTLYLAYLWICGCSYSTTLAMTSHSSNTIVGYFGFFRQLVTDSLEEEDVVVGGPGVVVEVDESKFGKRKYHRGKYVEGAWVLGGVERTEERRFFVVVVEKRDSATICNVLSKYVAEGSVLYSDCWKGYADVEHSLNLPHFTVNHSVGFKDTQTGVHTNSIEGKWSLLKRRITLRGRVKELLPGYLMEQIWRNRHRNALWKSFMNALAEIYYA